MGFEDAQTIDVSVTTTQEQRSSDWMRFHSLSDFLDPLDPNKSIEGHPAPRRAIVTANLPL
jgi:tRNA (mo5U34)-methyltransferase